MICPLEHIKQYMQITHDADDALILMLASAAEEYLLKAGVRAQRIRGIPLLYPRLRCTGMTTVLWWIASWIPFHWVCAKSSTS